MTASILPYRTSLALATDLYQLTMAYGYWTSGRAETEGAFQLFFRTQPFPQSFTIAAGLEYVVDLIEHFSFAEDDLEYLGSLEGADGKPLFPRDFLTYLADLQFSGDVDAVPEGTVVFPHEPILRVSAPLPQAQILETVLLTVVNFQTLIATKARRIVEVAGQDPVLEFGARRAQGLDGALAASRAAYLGGCAATSNVLAGKLFGIPVRGTHAHSWVMAFDSEEEAFRAYASALPSNCIFLVDTYDTLRGVRQAIEAGKELRERGHSLLGIRLDSGDLAQLSIQARRLLDEAGFQNTQVVASGDLDELEIDRLKRSGARISVWGVGTRLVTAWDQPALGGVYKLAAVRSPGDPWSYRLKVSDGGAKGTIPGLHRVRRFLDEEGNAVADALYLDGQPPGPQAQLVLPLTGTSLGRTPREARHVDVLVPVFRAGRRVYEVPALAETRARVDDELAQFRNPRGGLTPSESYTVGATTELYELRQRMVAELGAR